MQFQKEFYPTPPKKKQKKNQNDNSFPLLSFGFIQMKVDTTLILPGCYEFERYSVLR